MEQTAFKIKTYGVKELAELYGVTRQTFSKSIKKIPGLYIMYRAKILYPNQVKMIVEHLGEPDN